MDDLWGICLDVSRRPELNGQVSLALSWADALKTFLQENYWHRQILSAEPWEYRRTNPCSCVLS